MDQSLRTRYYLNSPSVQLNVCFKAVRDKANESREVSVVMMQEILPIQLSMQLGFKKEKYELFAPCVRVTSEPLQVVKVLPKAMFLEKVLPRGL